MNCSLCDGARRVILAGTTEPIECPKCRGEGEITTPEAKQLDYEIENIGGIDHIALRLTPGVNILRGRNAAGKTSAIRAIERAQGGKAAIERRDGSSQGYVRGPGVTLSVRQVAKTTGEAEMELADTGPLARLIDPGMKGNDAAARERIRALIELLNLEVEDEFLELLTQKDEGLHIWLRKEVSEDAIEDLMEVAELLRHKAHSRAREQEADAERAEGVIGSAGKRADDLLDALGGPDKLTGIQVGEARKKLDEMTRRHERAVAQCEARETLAERQDKIRENLGARPELAASEEKAQEIDGVIVSLQGEIAAAEKQMRVLTEKIGKLKASRDVERVRAESQNELIRRQLTAIKSWESHKAVLDQPLEGPTRERVTELKEQFVDDARFVLDDAEQSADYRSEEERRAQAVRERDEASKLAEHYRDLAAGIPEKLGEILASAGAPGLTVIDGRLHATADGGAKDYEYRCSTGERVALALRVAATAYQDKVLPLDGLLWASLDPDNKAAFVQLAEEFGLYVITEEPAPGPIRLEKGASRRS